MNPNDFSNIPSDPNQVTLDHIWSVYSALEMPKLCAETQNQLPALFRRFVEEMGGGGRLVSSIRRFEIGLWLERNKERWPSAWTRKGKLHQIARVFSWAMEMEIGSKNPLWRFKTDTPTIDTQPITREQFQKLLRGANPHFRRLLLFLRRTGCRPGEAEALRWSDVDLDRAVCILKVHKTSRKTGKPRLIPLPRTIVRMLRWMQDHPQQTPITTATQLYHLLAAGPVRAFRVSRWKRALGISDRQLHQARQTLGIRVDGQGKHIGVWYRLPDGAQPPRTDPRPEYVFQNEDGGRWTKYTFSQHFRRLAKRAGLPLSVRAYTMRHGFITDAIAGGVSLLLISRCVGHVNTQMIERTYLHLDNRIDLLTGAVEEAQRFLGNGNK